MFQEEIAAVAQLAVKKVNMMKSRTLAYFILAMLAGIYVALAMFFIFTIGGQLKGTELAPLSKTIMGFSFPVALSLVMIAGSELFTGNNFVMTIGVYRKQISVMDMLKLWCICWLGNLTGSIIVAVLFSYTGIAQGAVGEYIAAGALAKMSLSPLELIMRGLFCNILVCLAVWCTLKMKSESGKLIMIFWCIFAFITTGFEHSVANMSFLVVGILNPMGEALSWGGYIYNLLFVTLGNIIGGALFVGLSYAIVAGKEE